MATFLPYLPSPLDPLYNRRFPPFISDDTPRTELLVSACFDLGGTRRTGRRDREKDRRERKRGRERQKERESEGEVERKTEAEEDRKRRKTGPGGRRFHTAANGRAEARL